VVFSANAVAQPSSELKRIFDERDASRYADATEIYLSLLQQASEQQISEELVWHLHLLDLIVPPASPVRAALSALQGDTGRHADVATLVQWWHQQDPIPATFVNERLVEHLSRAYHALNNFALKHSPLKVDDRGAIFVRLGMPGQRSEVKLRNAGSHLRPVRHTLARNEFWTYRHINENAHYFFVKKSNRRGYKIAAVDDLLPTQIRTRPEEASILLIWLEEIYRQLSADHEHYGPLYDTVSNYASIASSDGTSAYSFTKQLLQDGNVLHNFHQESRSREVPTSATQVLRSAISLHPCLRWARFLEPEGTTRLNVSWTFNTTSLQPNRQKIRSLQRKGAEPSENFLLTAYLITRKANYAPANLRLRQYYLPDGVNSALPVHTWVTKGIQGSINLALQWNHAWAQPDASGKPQSSAMLGIGVQTLDSIPALNGSGQVLEMSDILLTGLNDKGLPDEKTPVVATSWTPETPLGIYFEAYFLRFNEDEHTNYTVSYEVRNLGDPQKAAIATSTEHESESSTVREHIVLDVSDWQAFHQVDITVRVMDNTSGDTVKRSVVLDPNPQVRTCSGSS
jgi:GWxTD domain-containing protein